MTRAIFALAAIVVAGPACGPGDQTSNPVLELFPAKCSPGLHHQPAGPFAVLVFCEDALGSHIGVVHYDNLSDPIAGSWRLTDRFWQQGAWAADVDSIAWAPGGKFLYVATGEVYGTGGLFELDLWARTWRRIEPPGSPDSVTDSGVQYHIIEIDSDAGVLRYSPGAGVVRLPAQ